jgi:hypothetical protein
VRGIIVDYQMQINILSSFLIYCLEKLKIFLMCVVNLQSIEEDIMRKLYITTYFSYVTLGTEL